MAKITDALLLFNPWWKEGWNLEYKEREIYAHIKRFFEQPQILAFTGLRRVGKTTLMLKIVEDKIRGGFNPRRIVYFSFDEFQEIELRSLIGEYSELMEQDMREGQCLLILDEIQKLKNWENQVKTIYDALGKSTKIIISGSESLFIRKKSKETLAGRIFEFKIEPLSFREFLGFKGIEWKPVGLHRRELGRLFWDFALTQGFPELVDDKDEVIIRKYIQDGIIDRVVFRDLQLLVPVKDISVLHSLLNIFLEEPGQLTEISKLSQDLGVSRQTLSNYLQYLEDAFLLRKLYNYSKSRRKVERKLKKVYPVILSPALLFKDDQLSRSKVFEWLVVNQLKAEFFWRDPYKNEVDVILWEKKTVPVEIKYGKVSTGGMDAFMRKFKVKAGYILSRDVEETRQSDRGVITVMPAFKYLLQQK